MLLDLLRTLAPTDPILLLGIVECDERDIDQEMIKDLFSFSRRNQYDIQRPLMVSFGEPDHVVFCSFDFSHPATNTSVLS